MTGCKITVLKRTLNKEISDLVLPEQATPCALLTEGDEFFTRCPDQLPEGFCPWAWHDIHKYVLTLLMGGDFHWMRTAGTVITCCNDGVRPVIFRLERVEDQS